MSTKASYTPEELAKEWSCHVATIYRLIRGGRLRAFRLGGGRGGLRISDQERRRVEESRLEPVGG